MSRLLTSLLACLLTVLPALAYPPACSLSRCQCSDIGGTYSYELACDLGSIVSYDATFASLPPDVESLTLMCESKSRRSMLSPKMLSRFVRLKSLSIELCNVTILTPDSFAGLADLEAISIVDTALPELELSTFVHLPKLERLTVVGTGIGVLPDISHMTSLRYLNISKNNIHAIGDGTDSKDQYSLHPNLTLIELSHNRFRSLPLTLLRGAPSVQLLYMKGLLALAQFRFPDDVELRDLIELDARENKFEVVEIPRLNLAIHLEKLHLCGAGNEVQLTGLSSLANLEELSLVHFGITDTIWTQLNSSRLVRLDLSGNNLTSVDVSLLPALKILRVGENQISTLDSNTFVHQPELLLVNITRNRLKTLPGDLFASNAKLVVLDLSHNELHHLGPMIFNGLTGLVLLDLSHNNIQSLNDTFSSDLRSVHTLRLQRNKLSLLPDMSRLSNLNTLDVSYNQLISLTEVELKGLGELQLLDANDNNLTFVVPDLVTACCPNLLQLLLHNNRINNVGTFGHHPRLMFVRLDNNSMTDFETVSPFAEMRDLRYLFLHRNRFTSIRTNWFPPSLQILTMGENDIRQAYSTSFKNLPNLISVDLVGSRYALLLPMHAINSFRDNKPKPVFELAFNTFQCSCEMAYMKVIEEDGYSIDVFNRYYPQIRGLDTAHCVTPYEGNSVRPFHDVPLSHFACEYREMHCDVLCDCCSSNESCPCALTCPSECKCFTAGTGFKKVYFHIHCGYLNLSHVPLNIPSRSTGLYLDGNVLTRISPTDIGHLYKVEVIYLNGSRIQTIDDGAFANTSALVTLRLEDNLFTSLSDASFGKLTRLRELYLHNNLISSISPAAFVGMTAVETITLHDNRLVVLDAVCRTPSLLALTLSGNPWACPCNNSHDVLRLVHELNDVILDRPKMCCFVGVGTETYEGALDGAENMHDLIRPTGATGGSNEDVTVAGRNSCHHVLSFDFESLCVLRVGNVSGGEHVTNAESTTLLVALVVAILVLLMLVTLAILVMVRGRELQAWLFVNIGVRVYDKKAHIDKQDAGTKSFDAFISYSSKDSEFVAQALVPELDKKGYRTCVHYRDFPVGRNITDTIFKAIEESSRTVLVLSRNFLESEWCRFEFQTAHHHILCEGSHRLIVVLLGNIPDDMLDPDLKVHLKSKTYLKFGDPWFWEKLYFSLPDIKGREVEEKEQDVLRGMKILSGEIAVGQGHEKNNATIE
ncbi:unnamed protein product [Lymnaea stagnalis]|uniref:TIR domain-containing protein n=1 Tax=Lymnaea stagnalis TaxID=6523 RepID=A0AAV2IBC7_LYMST